MAHIENGEIRYSTLCLSGIDLACLLETSPQQVCRWRDEGFLKQVGINYYEPMAAIRAIVNWKGRGRVPKPVIEWRERMAERPHRKAYLHGMAHAFDLVSRIMARKARPWGVEFYSYDPAEDEDAGEDDAGQEAGQGPEQAAQAETPTPPQGTPSD